MSLHLEAPDSDGAATPSGPVTFHWRLALLITLFWTFYGAIIATNLVTTIVPDAASAAAVLGFAFGGAYLWAALSPPLFRLVNRLHLARPPRGAGVGALVTIGIVVALLVSTTVAALSLLLDTQLRQLGFATIFRYRVPLDLLASLLILAAGAAREYLRDLQVRQQETVALRAQLVEARLESLRTQLNPHFLFNTLNAVAALATSDPRRVQRILAQLSDLLRYMLAGTAAEEIPLKSELTVLRRYFDILELRYEEWLETSIDCSPDAEQALVPNLILQPLAENAIKHGVGRAGGEGWIAVRASRSGDDLVLTITDSGAGEGAQTRSPAPLPEPGSGFGLRHTRERLEQLYGSDYSFDLTPTAEGGMVAEVRLPFHTHPQPPEEVAGHIPAESGA